MTREKFCNYAKDGKNCDEKNDVNDHLEENRYKENGEKNNNLGKYRKLDENEICENVLNECFKDDKKGKNNKKTKK